MFSSETRLPFTFTVNGSSPSASFTSGKRFVTTWNTWSMNCSRVGEDIVCKCTLEKRRGRHEMRQGEREKGRQGDEVPMNLSVFLSPPSPCLPVSLSPCLLLPTTPAQHGGTLGKCDQSGNSRRRPARRAACGRPEGGRRV